jgi:predicted AlkP superfamily phosphohydrolase/phosphomutase
LNRPTEIHRVVLVVLDGLRPDAIPTFSLTRIAALAADGASTWAGRTVAPSVTAAVVASLMTGTAPARHGVVSDRFHIPPATWALITLTAAVPALKRSWTPRDECWLRSAVA